MLPFPQITRLYVDASCGQKERFKCFYYDIVIYIVTAKNTTQYCDMKLGMCDTDLKVYHEILTILAMLARSGYFI